MPGTTTEDRSSITTLEQIPNVGPATAGDLQLLGYAAPGNLRGADPYAMFDDLVAKTGHRQDPCVLDVFISVVRYMDGAPAKPWWAYTAERKKTLETRQ